MPSSSTTLDYLSYNLILALIFITCVIICTGLACIFEKYCYHVPNGQIRNDIIQVKAFNFKPEPYTLIDLARTN